MHLEMKPKGLKPLPTAGGRARRCLQVKAPSATCAKARHLLRNAEDSTSVQATDQTRAHLMQVFRGSVSNLFRAEEWQPLGSWSHMWSLEARAPPSVGLRAHHPFHDFQGWYLRASQLDLLKSRRPTGAKNIDSSRSAQ